MESKKSNVEQITYNTLDNLLGGIYEAIVNAQKTVSVASMNLWRDQHFNKDNTPKTIKFQLPTGTHEIPTAVLVNESNMSIKDVEFEMEMKLDINEEIEKDLGKDRTLDWAYVKSLAVSRGWYVPGKDLGLGRSRQAIFIPNNYRLLRVREGGKSWISVWTPNGAWSPEDHISVAHEQDLRHNEAFRYWLDVNKLQPSEWGINSPALNKKNITADSSSRGAGNMAKIKVTFEGKEAPEGIARLNDVYVKMIPSS